MALVKICGLKTTEAASVAIENGTDLLGMILVPNRQRTVDLEEAKRITSLARNARQSKNRTHQTINSLLKELYSREYSTVDDFQITAAGLVAANGPFAVGVFRNQSVEQVYEMAQQLELDFIQLHGSEDKLGYAQPNKDLKYGIIPRFVIPTDNAEMTKVFSQRNVATGIILSLLDSEAGGEGKTIDWSAVGDLTEGRYLLAGGLTPENVQEALLVKNVIGVDVSGGVETSGVKDLTKVAQFIQNARK
ncbi:hypothetical protein CAAN1_03S01156 [[Candida] anglica]|uniref:N-(5'-phosphoribosyl)anthranilate isomerase n=1 Tax=[Candida] anglica TaxID=148631 RepID=A0ABP0EI90_9ASCO